MPDKPSYLQRLPAILAEAKAPKPIPFLRRKDVEALFGLKRRQALKLMHRIGAIRVSREIAVDQKDLVAWLAQLAGDAADELRRHERVVSRIVDLKAETAARAVKIVLPDAPPSPDLPDGVSLAPGVLTVRFADGQQLLERLFLLARVLATKPQLISELQQPQ